MHYRDSDKNDAIFEVNRAFSNFLHTIRSMNIIMENEILSKFSL